MFLDIPGGMPKGPHLKKGERNHCVLIWPADRTPYRNLQPLAPGGQPAKTIAKWRQVRHSGLLVGEMAEWFKAHAWKA